MRNLERFSMHYTWHKTVNVNLLITFTKVSMFASRELFLKLEDMADIVFQSSIFSIFYMITAVDVQRKNKIAYTGHILTRHRFAVKLRDC